MNEMDPALANLGWTEDQWNRICSAVTEEAQRARVAAQVLPAVGMEGGSTIAIPEYRMTPQPEPFPFGVANQRLGVNSDPTLHITTISVNVPLRAHEIEDPQLKAALVMFRRAANYVARIEDTLVFSGRPGPDMPPLGLVGIPPVYRVTGNGAPAGIFLPALAGKILPPYGPVGARVPSPPVTGNDVFNQIIAAINRLERGGATGPFACVLSHTLFERICTPTDAMVLPRDRILPFLQGPLLRSSQITNPRGCVVALGGSPIELVIASEIGVRFLQTTPEPRQMFRVSERVALRIKEPEAIAMIG
jgi:uncharacterized linocin/CFP29 family protein